MDAQSAVVQSGGGFIAHLVPRLPQSEAGEVGPEPGAGLQYIGWPGDTLSPPARLARKSRQHKTDACSADGGRRGWALLNDVFQPKLTAAIAGPTVKEELAQPSPASLVDQICSLADEIWADFISE